LEEKISLKMKKLASYGFILVGLMLVFGLIEVGLATSEEREVVFVSIDSIAAKHNGARALNYRAAWGFPSTSDRSSFINEVESTFSEFGLSDENVWSEPGEPFPNLVGWSDIHKLDCLIDNTCSTGGTTDPPEDPTYPISQINVPLGIGMIAVGLILGRKK